MHEVIHGDNYFWKFLDNKDDIKEEGVDYKSSINVKGVSESQ